MSLGLDGKDLSSPPSKENQNPESRNAELAPTTVAEETIRQIIERTRPTGIDQRNALVFDFCRELKALPAYADAPAQELKPIVRRWWESALPVITTKSFDVTWADFVHGWKRVRFPKGQATMPMMLAQARQTEYPSEAMEYDNESFRLLVSLCRVMQRACGAQPFFLSVRTAGNLLGVDPSTASRWLECLEADGIIRCVEKGSQLTRRASRFRYLLPL
jgi:hypothetical protein